MPYYDDEILWGALWRAESEWLPFLGLVLVLVFWRAGLYAERERRGGGGRIIGSLILVGLVGVVYGVGTNREFGTYGLAPTAVVLSGLFIGLLRASYEVVTGDILRMAGVRRRAILVGDSSGSGTFAASSARAGAASATSSSAQRSRRICRNRWPKTPWTN